MLVNLKAIWLLPSIYGLLLWDGLNFFLKIFFFIFLVSIKSRHSWSVMPLLFLFPLYSVTSLGLRHALCIQFAKIKLLVQIYFLYKLLWHKQQICYFKKIYKYSFLLYKYLQYSLPHFITFTIHGLPHPSLIAPSPPSRSQPDMYLQFHVGGSQRRRAPPQEESVQGEGGGG